MSVQCSKQFRLKVAAAVVNLLTNPGFEAGSFAGWTKINTLFTFITPAAAHSGSYGVKTTDTPISFVAQTVNTGAGKQFTVSVWTKLIGDGVIDPSDHLEIWWEGHPVFSHSFTTYEDWALYQVAVTATGPTSQVRFGANMPDHWMYLDDCSLTLTP